MAYPLEGIRVLDFSRVLAGPFAGRMLRDLGADVVKIEPPEGDVTRLWGAGTHGLTGYFTQQNVGKRNLCLDLNQDGAAALVHELVREADVVVENFRPGVMARLGIGWEALASVNPRLVMLSISGFGQVGPESHRAAYAPIIHAETGVVARQAAQAAAHPTDMPVSIADTNASLHGLVGLLSALFMREQTGQGQQVDMAMLDAMLVTDDHLHYSLDDAEASKPMSSEVWETVLGPLMLAGDFRHIWRQLTRIHGVEDPTPPGAPLGEKIRLRREVAVRFFRDIDDEQTLIAALDAMNLAWGRVNASVDVAERSPSVAARGTIRQVDDRGGGSRPVVESPYHFSAAESGIRGSAAYRGEHNREVLAEWLEMTREGMSRLEAAGVLLADQALSGP